MRKHIVAGNWKMNKTFDEADELISNIMDKLEKTARGQGFANGLLTEITFIEFISGCIVNLWGKLEVWDYSDMPANFLGQICLYYSILWGLLTIPIAAVCTMIRKMLRY